VPGELWRVAAMRRSWLLKAGDWLTLKSRRPPFLCSVFSRRSVPGPVYQAVFAIIFQIFSMGDTVVD
jgi:hypothetical protein